MDEADELQRHVRRLATGGWQWVGTSGEGDSITLGLFGVNPWKYKWASLGMQVELEEPACRQRENVELWRIEVGGKWVYFAAVELTPGMYGFWRPTGS